MPVDKTPARVGQKRIGTAAPRTRRSPVLMSRFLGKQLNLVLHELVEMLESHGVVLAPLLAFSVAFVAHSLRSQPHISKPSVLNAT